VLVGLESVNQQHNLIVPNATERELGTTFNFYILFNKFLHWG